MKFESDSDSKYEKKLLAHFLIDPVTAVHSEATKQALAPSI